jgi:hypothetical protein
MEHEVTENMERKRLPGGYIWRERLEDVEQIALDLLVDEDDAGKRSRLRKAIEILRELQRYRCGGGD